MFANFIVCYCTEIYILLYSYLIAMQSKMFISILVDFSFPTKEDRTRDRTYLYNLKNSSLISIELGSQNIFFRTYIVFNCYANDFVCGAAKFEG